MEEDHKNLSKTKELSCSASITQGPRYSFQLTGADLSFCRKTQKKMLVIEVHMYYGQKIEAVSVAPALTGTLVHE